jgi:hypothetical protein
MGRGRAWLLDLGAGASAAIGERELVLLVYDTAAFPVPHAPRYANRVLFWDERALPIVDLPVRVGVASAATETKFVAIVGYRRDGDSRLHYGALPLAAPPVRAAVDDAAACALPEGLERWRSIAVSCFRAEGVPIPVLDLGRAFGPPG